MLLSPTTPKYGDPTTTSRSLYPGRATMAFQYPPPPGDDMSSSTEGPFHNTVTSNHDQDYPRDMPERLPQDGSYSSPDKNDLMKRAASTPNIRNQAAADAALAASADKRRNKLGYHRTSVACGEFRPSPEDSMLSAYLLF